MPPFILKVIKAAIKLPASAKKRDYLPSLMNVRHYNPLNTIHLGSGINFS